MSKTLQAVAALLAVAAVGTWLVTGAHRGWTKTSVQKMTLDEITGIESPSYEKRFVAGVDFLGVGLLGAGVLGGISFLFRKSTKHKN
jgi:hypothetical protein